MGLPHEAAKRKAIPIGTGVLDYFPDALAEVAKVSKAGNDQHNPGQPLHWAREKSTDHSDCIIRHFLDRKTRDPEDGQWHAAKLAWRALAYLQILIEEERENEQREEENRIADSTHGIIGGRCLIWGCQCRGYDH